MIHPDRLKLMSLPEPAGGLRREGGDPATIQRMQSFQGPKAPAGFGFPGAMQPYPPAGAPYGYGMPAPYNGMQPVPYVDPNVIAQPQYPPPVLQQPPQSFNSPWAGSQGIVPSVAPDRAGPSSDPKPPKIIGDWQQFESPEGKSYYFNSRTQETTWNAPPEFANVAKETQADSEWQTFHTPEGKPYYYNPRLNQTVWEKPTDENKVEVESVENKESTLKEQEEEQKSESVLENEPKKDENVVIDPLLLKPYQPWSTKEYATREEAVEAFHALLSSSGVPSTATWEQALPKIVHDKRYRSLTKLNERKEAFKEWCVKHADFERAEAKRLAVEKRSNFEAMLSEFKDRLHPRIRYVEIEPLVRSDARYAALEARDREDVFYSYVDKIAEEERKAKVAQRKEREEAFRNFLTSSGKLTTKMQWRVLLDSIRNEEVYKSLDPADALKVFEQVMSEMKREEDKRILAEREAAREAERKRRADFRTLLLEHMNAGTLHLRTRWRTFCEVIRDDPRFVALTIDAKHNGQTLFDDFCDELEDRVLTSRKKLKEAMVASSIDVIRDTDSPQDLLKKLEGAEALKGVPDIHVQVLLNEYIDHAQSKAAHAARRLEKYSGLFAKLLSKKIRKPMPWEAAVPLLDSHSAYKKLGENVRDDMFKKHIESLKENGIVEENIDDTDGEIEEEPPKKIRSPSFGSRRKHSRSPRRRRSRSPRKSPGRRKRSRSISTGRRRHRDRSPPRRRR